MNYKAMSAHLEKEDFKTMKYFTEKYASFTIPEALALAQKDPEFIITSAKTHKGMEYIIKLNLPSKLN